VRPAEEAANAAIREQARQEAAEHPAANPAAAAPVVAAIRTVPDPVALARLQLPARVVAPDAAMLVHLARRASGQPRSASPAQRLAGPVARRISPRRVRWVPSSAALAARHAHACKRLSLFPDQVRRQPLRKEEI
jgi:hypothetical protein